MTTFRHKKGFPFLERKACEMEKKAQFYSSSSASKAESSESKSASKWAVNFFTRCAAGNGGNAPTHFSYRWYQSETDEVPDGCSSASIIGTCHLSNFGDMPECAAYRHVGMNMSELMCIEALSLRLEGSPWQGSIRYSMLAKGGGWSDAAADGEPVGEGGRSLRWSAIKVWLTGDVSLHFDLEVRAFNSNVGWTAGTMDGSALARARRTLRALHEAGLLCDDSYAAALSVCRLDYGSWELYTAPCGLTQLVRSPEEIYTGADTEHVYIQLILSDDDAPLYFNYQNDLGQGDTLADDAVAQYCALLGLDEFTDWQYPDWGTAVRDFGAAGYSETAQVYAVANASGYSVTLSAASMTPQTFAALNTQYGEEIS